MALKTDILQRVRNLNVNKSGDRRAPHKPLLLLLALAKMQKGEYQVSFTEVEETLRPLLDIFAPPVKSRHQPELPYWYLPSDNLWEIDDADQIARQRSGFPKINALRQTSGHIPKPILDEFIANPRLVNQVISELLDLHFPESLHEDLQASIGFSTDPGLDLQEPSAGFSVSRKRNPNFRTEVLRAYEHRCAVTGFRASLGASYFGCEAAHVQWHAYDGPDTVNNGIALEPTMHKLFDAGAWSLTDDRRILVSAEFTGSSEATQRLRAQHGKHLDSPQHESLEVSLSFIRWHREAAAGGVFRIPALPL